MDSLTDAVVLVIGNLSGSDVWLFILYYQSNMSRDHLFSTTNSSGEGM